MVSEEWSVAYPLPEVPAGAPVFETARSVRIGDTRADQRLRLDAVARYLQDVGYDHLQESPDGDRHQAWIVRRTVIDMIRPLGFGERVRIRRWCSAVSNRWVNIRVRLESESGGLAETEAFWIHCDPEAGVPARMSDEFLAPWLPHTTDHRLRWHTALPAPLPTRSEPGVQTTEFPIRVTDFDWWRHLNNPVYLHAVEQVLANHQELLDKSYRTIIEYPKAIAGDDVVALRSRRADDTVDIWFEVGGGLRTVAQVSALG